MSECCGNCKWRDIRGVDRPDRIAPCLWPQPVIGPLALSITGTSRKWMPADTTGCPTWEAKEGG